MINVLVSIHMASSAGSVGSVCAVDSTLRKSGVGVTLLTSISDIWGNDIIIHRMYYLFTQFYNSIDAVDERASTMSFRCLLSVPILHRIVDDTWFWSTLTLCLRFKKYCSFWHMHEPNIIFELAVLKEIIYHALQNLLGYLHGTSQLQQHRKVPRIQGQPVSLHEAVSKRNYIKKSIPLKIVEQMRKTQE